MVDVAIPVEAEFKTRLMLAVPAVFPVGCWVVLKVPAVGLTPVIASVPTVGEVDRFWLDTNINGRSIPNKKYKVLMWPGIFAKKTTTKNRILTYMLS